MAGRGAARNGGTSYTPPPLPPAAHTADGGAQKITPTPANRPGGQEGDRQASIEQQRMAPLRQGGVAAPEPTDGPADPATAEAPPVNADQSVWGPTERPWEPVTTGAQLGAGAAPDARQNLRDLLGTWYQQHGDADGLLALLENLDAGG